MRQREDSPSKKSVEREFEENTSRRVEQNKVLTQEKWKVRDIKWWICIAQERESALADRLQYNQKTI